MWKKNKNTTSLNGEEIQKNKKKNNRDIWFTGIFFSLLFAAMIGYYIYFGNTKELFNDTIRLNTGASGVESL